MFDAAFTNEFECKRDHNGSFAAISAPVPARIKERIIKGDYIDFTTLLPKAMLSSSVEPDHPGSLTLQLPSGPSDFTVHRTVKGRKVTSFSSWMEAWNVYLAIRVDHTPSCAPSLIAYQRIITSASPVYLTPCSHG